MNRENLEAGEIRVVALEIQAVPGAERGPHPAPGPGIPLPVQKVPAAQETVELLPTTGSLRWIPSLEATVMEAP